MKTKLLTLILLLALSGTNFINARDQFSRTVKREYNVNPDAQLIVDNKFGTIHCNNWDKNVISIEVTITVEAANDQAASKIMDKITFSLSGTPEKVEAKTMIEEGGIRKNGHMTIDYIINLPASVNMDLTNKFGDIFVNELNGKGRFNLSYGNMTANKLNNSDNLLDIKFSQVIVQSMKGAVVMLKYSGFELEYAGSLRLDSKFSNIDAAKVIALNVNFEGGTLKMDNSSAVESKSKFSDLKIGRIEKSLSLDIQYGTCNVEEMPADFSSINIVNKYGNVSVGLPETASYSLDAYLKFCDLEFPEEKGDFNQKITSNNMKTYKGTIGKASSGGKVTVRSEFGDVSLR